MKHSLAFTLNGTRVTTEVEPQTLLVELLRDQHGLTGTHIGCDTSQCGCCVVHVDGDAIKSCAMLAVAVADTEVLTIEGLATADGLHPMQAAFHACHALQCGYCTPGMIMSALALLKDNPNPTESEVREGLEGNLCRCTGYHNIVRAVIAAAAQMREG